MTLSYWSIRKRILLSSKSTVSVWNFFCANQSTSTRIIAVYVKWSIRAVYVRYMCGICAVYVQYTCSICAVYAQYTCGICAIYMQYTCSIRAVYAQYAPRMRADLLPCEHLSLLSLLLSIGYKNVIKSKSKSKSKFLLYNIFLAHIFLRSLGIKFLKIRRFLLL